MTVKVQAELSAKDNLSPTLEGVERTLQKFKISVETNKQAMNKLDGALRGLGAQAASLPGPLGQVADALADFAPGGVRGAAFLAGIGAMIMILKSAYDATERTKKINEEYAQTIADIENRGKEFKLTNLQEELRKLGEESEDGWRKFWYGSDGRLFGFGESLENRATVLKGQIAKTTDDIRKSLDSAQKRIRTTSADVQMARAEQTGTGLQERVRQTKELVLQADIRLGIAKKENKSQEEIANLEADLNEARATNIRAITALQKEESKSKKPEIDFLVEISKLRSLNISEVNTLISAETVLINQLNNKNISLEKEIELRKKLNDVQNTYLENILKPLPPIKPAETQKLPTDKSFQVKPVEVSPIIQKQIRDSTAEQDKQRQETVDKLLSDKMAKFEPVGIAATDAISAMTEALVNGDNAFQAFGRSAKESINGILKSLARQNIVEGLSALAKGTAALFDPKTAVAAPGFFKSAGLHFAAAAAAGVGAGVTSSGGGGVGGGAGIGGTRGVNNSTLGQTGTTQGTITINITGGGILDMTNTNTQRSFIRALESVTNKRAVVLGV